MIAVTVLAFDSVLTSSLSGINDLLYFASTIHKKSASLEEQVNFQVQIASPSGRPVKARAVLIATMTASVPEFMNRILSKPGLREQMCSA